MAPPFITGDDGIKRCTCRRVKICYASIDDAWRAAFRSFAQSGLLLTPYKCGRSRRWKGEVHTRLVGNPWAWEPWRQTIRLRRVRETGCGEWHLTSMTNYVLPP